jgi:hypothetical protein
MKYLTDLTQEYLKSILHYNPKTGLWMWLIDNYRYHAGDEAGAIGHKGYVIITINAKKYRANRLAWLYMTGEWPKAEVDHDNNLKYDNRWINLREANGSENCYNYPVKITNKLGVKGVYLSKGRYRAQIQINKKKIFLGSFSTLEEAKAAHDKAANELQGEFVHISIAKEANAS